MKSFHPLRVVVEERSKLSELFFPDETACGWLLTQLPNVTSRGRAKSWPTLDRRPIKNAKQPPPPSLKNSAEWKLNLIIFALGGSNRRCPTRHKGRRGWRRRPTKKIPLLAGVGINPLDISSKKKNDPNAVGTIWAGRRKETEDGGGSGAADEGALYNSLSSNKRPRRRKFRRRANRLQNLPRLTFGRAPGNCVRSFERQTLASCE